MDNISNELAFAFRVLSFSLTQQHAWTCTHKALKDVCWHFTAAHSVMTVLRRLPDTAQTDWLLIFKTVDNEFEAHPLALAYLWKAQSQMIKEAEGDCSPWPGIIAEMKITCGSGEGKLAAFIKDCLFCIPRCSVELKFGLLPCMNKHGIFKMTAVL